jgi:hypothetical protein
MIPIAVSPPSFSLSQNQNSTIRYVDDFHEVFAGLPSVQTRKAKFPSLLGTVLFCIIGISDIMNARINRNALVDVSWIDSRHHQLVFEKLR